MISWDSYLDKEIDGSVMVLDQHNIDLSMKLKVYNAVVLPFLLYECEM